MESSEFERLLGTCAELAEWFPEGLVYIGGIAVYLHAQNTAAVSDLAETTHDADFYISLADMGDLRDLEEVTPNRRLSKHQLIKKGFEFDIYTERQSSLLVPYDAVVAHSMKYGEFRVAGLEHLFLLKLEAYRDRRQSSKGDKDARDLIRISAVTNHSQRPFDARISAPYLRDEHLELLQMVEKSPVVVELARGNAVKAKQLRRGFSAITQKLESAYQK